MQSWRLPRLEGRHPSGLSPVLQYSSGSPVLIPRACSGGVHLVGQSLVVAPCHALHWAGLMGKTQAASHAMEFCLLLAQCSAGARMHTQQQAMGPQWRHTHRKAADVKKVAVAVHAGLRGRHYVCGGRVREGAGER